MIRVLLPLASESTLHTETRVAAMALGVSEFLTKPHNPRDLLARIRAQLHQRRLTSDAEAILRRTD